MIELLIFAVLLVVGGAYLASWATVRDQEAKHHDQHND